MDGLVRATLLVRRIARAGFGIALTCGLATYVVLGGATAPLGPVPAIAAVLWGLLLTKRLRSKLRLTGDAPFLLDFELGALLAVGLDAALLRFDGTLSGRFSPATYVLVALVASFGRPLPGLAVVAWVVGLDAVIRYKTLGEPSLESLATQAGFACAFALLNLVLLRAEVARIRLTARSRVEEELKRLRDDARSYRLLGAGESRTEKEDAEERLARSSVEEIHQSVHYALELLRRCLDLHTAVLLWRTDSGTHLRISELSTASDDIHDAPFSIGDGVLAAVLAKKEAVLLENLRPSYKIPYYASACPVRALAAIPVIDDGIVRGVLALDRVDNRPFSPHEHELAAQAARYCLRAIQNERVFVQLERAKVEQGKLYRAAQALGAALSEKDVVEAGVRAAREIASFDLAAVTIWDETTKMHEVCAAKSENREIEDLVGQRFKHNTGLVSMVVTNRFPLPYKGEFDAAHQTVLTKRLPWPNIPSLLVLPLLHHGRPLGTLILGAKRRQAFGDTVRPTLEVLASHLAVSLSNARMVHKLETMATTDGMTGLFNKRAMLEQASAKVAAAHRFGRKLSVLVTDIDFFKKVNDTYGHDVGDVVIKGLGEILKRVKRTTDVVARFGGEEFVVLCEQTDEAGAQLLGERIREELSKTVFQSPNGPLKVTCSVGIATFPEAGGTWDELFKAADEALYVSKRGGRDRVSIWQPPSSARAKAG
ncbi:diguanylate cyclase/phosphodiesterase (GGDEF & EAL domains) with PAS/PAC sensor(s) [Labilithrix luteola]|uniref:diguanylate cyclase n=1 Tax=Labilithrix luteola TaxID=1391654 RepID=A0A0K1QDN2_9BACT|nr:sensor domain-containing diguanylate cyclase [Labilithrix luteola]AKV03828.1 diguanylate cyclase/phosphodiesterase (GGDEF & EAL domains) with PAS/PAC sensor(s) [Labilithrix luteola]